MRGSFCGVLALIAVASMALPVLGQKAQETTASADTRVSYAWKPYTITSRVTTVRTRADGKAVTSEEILTDAHDSRGRSLFVDLHPESNQASYTLDDPIAGTKTLWETSNRQAKVLKLPMAVPGRQSCWRLPDEEIQAQCGEERNAQSLETEIDFGEPSSQPAEPHSALPSQRGEPEATRAKAQQASAEPRVGETSYASCVDNSSLGISGTILEKKAEDLGNDTILGLPVHGCRITAKTSMGTTVRETWFIDSVLRAVSVKMTLRSVEQSPAFGNERVQLTNEVTRYSTDEPDPVSFRPPKDYEIKIVEMHEVPCEGPKQSPTALPAQ